MTCRICLEDGGTLISPCACKGTIAHVHEECLREWIKISNLEHCEICGQRVDKDPKPRLFVFAVLVIFLCTYGYLLLLEFKRF